VRSIRLNRAGMGLTAALVGLVVVLLLGVVSGTAQQGLESMLLRSPLDHEVLGQAPVADAISYPQEPNGDGTKGAGGVAVAHYAGGVTIEDEDILADAPEARLYRQRHNGWEPSIGVNDKGHVFVQSRTPELQPVVMRSTDEGNTFTDVSPNVAGVPTHPLSLDPFLYLDKDTGRVFTNNIPPTLTCQPISFSDDSGETWTNTQICGHFDHQNIFTGPPVTSDTIGYPNLVYYCAINLVALEGGSVATTCSKSLDGGLTWIHTGAPAYLSPMPPRQDQTGTICSGAIGHGFADHRGTIYLPRVWCGQPYLSFSRDEGLTWEQVRISDIGGVAHEASVVVDSQDNIYYTWIGRDRLPYLAISRDAGKTWGTPMMIAAPGVHRTSLPKMDIGDDGKIVVVYVGTDTDSKTAADWRWNAYMTVSYDALAEQPVFYTGSVNDPADPVTIGDCGPLRCNTLGDFFDVKIGPDGTPWAAFVDACDGPDSCITEFQNVGDRGEGIVGRLVGGQPLLTKEG
jgi:hypothetical protein